MKNYYFLVFMMFYFNASAQKIEQYYDYNWKLTDDMGRARYYALIAKKDTLWERKDYYLQEKKLQMKGNYIDKDTKIAQGTFHYYHANGYLQSVGDYRNGKKMVSGWVTAITAA